MGGLRSCAVGGGGGGANGRTEAIADGTNPSLPERTDPEGLCRWKDALGCGRDALVASGLLPQNTQNGLRPSRIDTDGWD